MLCSLFLDSSVKVPFLKKCKEAGLLNELFEGILGKLDSIHEKLLNETASESGTQSAKCKQILENKTFSFQAFPLPSLPHSLKALTVGWSDHSVKSTCYSCSGPRISS